MIPPAPRRPLHRVLGACLLVAAATVATTASADVPPPEGIKRVPYGFTVTNLAAFPEHVVVVYPWSLSNGAPTTEATVVKEGEVVPIGRRSATPKLWAVKKADWEAFAATHRPTGSFRDAPLTAFFETSGKAIACDATLQVRSEIPEADPRDRIVDAFRAEAIADGRCHVVAATAPAADATAPSSTGGPAASAAPSPAPAASSPPPSGSGCAGCTVGTASHGAGALTFLAAAIAVAIRSARRR